MHSPSRLWQRLSESLEPFPIGSRHSGPAGDQIADSGQRVAVAIRAGRANGGHRVTESLKKGLKSFRGKVLLVHYWAPSCPPRVAEFARLAKLQNVHESTGLIGMSVSVHELNDKGAVLDFLQKSGGSVYLRGKGDNKRFVEGIDKKWNRVVPATYMTGADGREIGKAHTGLMNYDELGDKLESSLK